MIEIIAVIFSLLSVYFTIKNKIVAWPIISYIGIDGKEHIYFIDFKIKHTNIVFEIKSNYYWNKN